jgi:hypothetical protein
MGSAGDVTRGSGCGEGGADWSTCSVGLGRNGIEYAGIPMLDWVKGDWAHGNGSWPKGLEWALYESDVAPFMVSMAFKLYARMTMTFSSSNFRLC